MRAIQSDPHFKQVGLNENLLPYMKYTGWKQVDENNPRWIVMNGHHDTSGEPLRLVFPRDKDSGEHERYIEKAINLLAALDEKPLEEATRGIVNYDRDLFYVRNVDEKDGRIPLDVAKRQIDKIHSVIGYSFCSEREPLAWFPVKRSSARSIVSQFGFAHTINHGFGFVIEAPRLEDPPQFNQMNLFDLRGEESKITEEIPMARRIMERIARGLIYSKQAEETRDNTVLLKEFTSGFNSNMCTAIVDMHTKRGPVLEYKFAWAPKVKTGEDVAERTSVKLRENGYDALENAARLLKKKEPEYITIEGNVRAVTTTDNPNNLQAKRAIVIRSLLLGASRPADVIVELPREHFSAATAALDKWTRVRVGGILGRTGMGWRLSDPQGFVVIG